VRKRRVPAVLSSRALPPNLLILAAVLGWWLGGAEFVRANDDALVPFNEDHTQHTEVLSVHIREVPKVIKYDMSVYVGVEITNHLERDVRGRVMVGGPTEGIYPVGDVETDFVIAAESSHTAVFRIAFDSTCRTGWYPVHAFVGLYEADAEVIQAVRLIETRFVDQPPWPAIPPSIGETVTATWDPVERLPTVTRLDLLMDYVNEEADLGDAPAFSLGGETGFKVMALPGKAGLLDGTIALVGPNKRLFFQGLHLALQGPAGIEGASEVRVEDFVVKRTEEGVDALHSIWLGDFPTQVVVQLRPQKGMLAMRVLSPDWVPEFGLGSASARPEAVTVGEGFRFAAPDTWKVDASSPSLAVSQVGVEYAGGMSLLQASDQPLIAFEVERKNRVGRAIVAGADWLYVLPSEESVFDAAIQFRSLHFKPAAPGVPELAGRIWAEDAMGSVAQLQKRLEELCRYGGERSAILLRNWQFGGEDWRPPDVWPPNFERGTLADYQRFGQQCQEAGVLWGLADDYSAIDPRTSAFSYDSVAFNRDGMPHNLAPSVEALLFQLRPDEAKNYLERNLKQIRSALVPTLSGIAGMDRPSEYFDKNGNLYTPFKARHSWAETLAFAREYLGPGSASVALGGGDWLQSAADGASLEVTPPEIPEDAVRVPWRILTQRDRMVAFARPNDQNASDDSVLLEEILGWRLPQTSHLDWGRSVVRKAWLSQPVAQFLNGSGIDKVRRVDDDWKQLRTLWTDGSVLWTNQSADVWKIADRQLPKDGFLVKGRDLDAAIELRNDVICEQVTSPGLWYANARPRHPRFLRMAPRIVDVTHLEDNLALFKFEWDCEDPLPGDVRVLVCAGDQVLDEHEPESKNQSWGGTVGYERRIDLSDLGGELDLSLAMTRPDGRPVGLVGESQADASVHPGFEINCGKLEVQRQEAELISQLKFKAAAATPEFPSSERINTERRPVDFGWVTTNGAFRLLSMEEGLRLIPLPDSSAFGVRLDLAKVGGADRKVVGMIGRGLYSAEWEMLPFKMEEGLLLIDHDPRWFAYDILLE